MSPNSLTASAPRFFSTIPLASSFLNVNIPQPDPSTLLLFSSFGRYQLDGVRIGKF
jgi:hypothetical protein